MSPGPVKRKLAAILAADAVGYSRMMAVDEEGTMKILSAHRAVIDGIIEFHEGRVVNTAGDSVLAEFASPIAAVRCAVEIQDALKTRNDSLREDRRMQFRIGVNLGDVMIKGDDLLGDGVNVAARLQSIAEPGKIYLSSSIYDQISGKLDLGFVDLGDQSLKNIDRPIRAYRVDREGRPAVSAGAARKPALAAGTWIGLLAGVVALAAAAWWYSGSMPSPRPGASMVAPAQVEDERARAQAELVKARTEAEAAKRALEEHRAAAEKARREAQASAKERPAEKIAAVVPSPAPAQSSAPAQPLARAGRYAGPWMAAFDCQAFGNQPARKFMVPFSVSTDLFELQFRERGQPGSFSLRGAPQADRTLQLSGGGFSAQKDNFGRPFPATFNTKLDGERFEGDGRLGARGCRLTLARR